MFAVACLAQTSNDQNQPDHKSRISKPSKRVDARAEVASKEKAISIAYAAALRVYGKKQIDSELPFKAELNNGIWTVFGTLNCGNCVGGTIVVRIDQATGKILSMIHTK